MLDPSVETISTSPFRHLIGKDVRAALNRYRVMAYVVGTMLIILVFIAIPLQYGASRPAMALVVAPLHGYLYIIYLVAGADLARRAHWRLGRILIVVCAGFVPFLAFYIERRVNQQMQAELAAKAVPAPLTE
jgi:integral membrane protein